MARQMALPPLKKGDRGEFEAVADIQILPNPPLSSGEVAEGLLKEELFGCGLGRAGLSVLLTFNFCLWRKDLCLSHRLV